jgi:hypothetical protein
VLFVIWAKPAIVGASVLHWRVPVPGHLRWLNENFTAAPVVINVISHQDTLKAMLRTSLQHKHLLVFEYNLRVYAAEATSA